MDPVTVAPGGKRSKSTTSLCRRQEGERRRRLSRARYGITKFDLLIDWGWFWFFTKPMFSLLDCFYKLVGNFGVAILIVTVMRQGRVLPARQQVLRVDEQDEEAAAGDGALKERYGDDKRKQQQEMMELYKKEKVNPAAGCLPIVRADPGVLRALQGALRHHRDAACAVLRLDQGPLGARSDHHLQPVRADPVGRRRISCMIGIWPLIMGVTMFLQMKLNPAPPDPVQQQMFAWMPVIFTFMLASFPAGLVIYWAWNNTLSVIQQYVIMRRQGVDVNLLENIGLVRKSAGSPGKS